MSDRESFEDDELLNDLLVLQQKEKIFDESELLPEPGSPGDTKDKHLNPDRGSRQLLIKQNIAGIVPTTLTKSDFKLPWHDCLMPLNKNYLAIERAVFECVAIGCRSIWIIGNEEITPLIKQRIGEIISPSIRNAFVLRVLFGIKDIEDRVYNIPIYYLPIHPRDEQKKRFGLAWSIVYGARRIMNISKNFSRFMMPTFFWVSFPWGVYPTRKLTFGDIRQEIKTSYKTTFLRTPEGKTAKDNEHVGFSFDPKYWRFMMKRYIQAERLIGLKKKQINQVHIEKRYSRQICSTFSNPIRCSY